MDFGTVLSLLFGLIGAVTGVVAIWVTYLLFKAGQQVNTQTLTVLSDIKASSRVTEQTTTGISSRLVEALIQMLSRQVTHDLAPLTDRFPLQLENLLNSSFPDARPDTIKKVKDAIVGQLDDARRSVSYSLASVIEPQEGRGLVYEKEDIGEAREKAGIPISPAARRVLTWIAENRPPKYAFLSVKFLRNKIFGADPAEQAALQYCIETGLLELYPVENPAKPEWPTTACRLNERHPTVKCLLSSWALVD